MSDKPIIPPTINPGQEPDPRVAALADVLAFSAGVLIGQGHPKDVVAEAFTITGIRLFIEIAGREETGRHLMGLGLHLTKDGGNEH